jgi:hypothetical protein
MKIPSKPDFHEHRWLGFLNNLFYLMKVINRIQVLSRFNPESDLIWSKINTLNTLVFSTSTYQCSCIPHVTKSIQKHTRTTANWIVDIPQSKAGEIDWHMGELLSRGKKKKQREKLEALLFTVHWQSLSPLYNSTPLPFSLHERGS